MRNDLHAACVQQCIWNLSLPENPVAPLVHYLCVNLRIVDRGTPLLRVPALNFEYQLGGDSPRQAGRAAEGSSRLDSLSAAVGEVLENAATHAGDTPIITVTVDTTETAGIVTVADDGPEIPQRETRAIDRGEENQLEHGRGIGLWLVSWIVDASDGALYVMRPDDGGTVVQLSLPLAEGAAADGTTSL